ncbi:DeoR/GlpR family DNA-binding transcription regulator [Paenibacillus humicus]|uniref:DeoR/GlpR family DNA-binding transcription regulator n=1 Tax=Paenibacillus humicus TaxID=412861 RepID=UPI003D265A23
MNSRRRRNEILEEVRRNGSVLVENLVDQYQLSVETIRRDLRILHEKGLVRRNYGGAERREQTTWEMPYTQRIHYNLEQKEAIAKEAIHLLEDGDSVFLDGNTTGLAVSRLIPAHKELVVVTNSIMVAFNLVQKNSRSQVFMVGGEVDQSAFLFGMDVKRISVLITDDGISLPFLEKLREMIQKVIVVKMEEQKRV